jgi:hypothetical protein
MAEIQLDEQGTPATPAAGKMLVYPDSAASVFVQKNDAGLVQGDYGRASVASQAPAVTDTYITGSGLIIPSVSLQAGTVMEWKLVVTKTAASTAAPIYQVRIGANQSTADTSRLSMTGPAQTAVVDEGILTILVTNRNVGAAGVLQGYAGWQHEAAVAAGFGEAVTGTSAGFDNTALGGQFIGLSITPGTAAAWTIQQCFGRIWY